MWTESSGTRRGEEAFDPFALEKTVAEVKWGPEVLEHGAGGGSARTAM